MPGVIDPVFLPRIKIHHQLIVPHRTITTYRARGVRLSREKEMTKAELIEKLHSSTETDITKKAVGELVDNLFDTMAVSIKKEKRFTYPGFGTFVVRTRKARKGRNPQTGEVIKIKASKSVGFRPAKALKERL